MSAVRQIVRSVRKDLRNLLLALRQYRNRGELVLAIAKRGPATGRLNNGLMISSPEVSTLLPVVDEVFYQRAYSPAGFTIGRNDIVVDIGAHIGIFSLFAARQTDGVVYAYEPFPGNAELLRSNIAANGARNIQVRELAVAGEIGIAALAVGELSVGNLVGPSASDGAVSGTLQVRSTTLEQIFIDENLHHIDFLKLDCEGCEGAILQATPDDVLRRVSKIAIEFHDNWSSMSHQQIVEHLRRLGFTTELSHDGQGEFGYVYAALEKNIDQGTKKEG